MVKIYSFTHSNDVNSLIMYIDNVLSKKYQQEIFTYLESMTDFEKGNSYFGEIPRLQKWYHRKGQYFSKTWKCKTHKRWISKEYDSKLSSLQKRMEIVVNDKIDEHTEFNSCLINKYRDDNDSIKPHRDTQSSFGVYRICECIVYVNLSYM